MNEEEMELVKKILALQDPQLQIDAIKIMQEKNILNEEKTLGILKEYLASINKDKYPLQEEQQQEQKQKYSQSFNEAIQKEREEKEEQRRKEESERKKNQRKMQQGLKAYEMQEKISKEIYHKSLPERIANLIKRLEKMMVDENNILEKQAQSHKKFLEENKINEEER